MPSESVLALKKEKVASLVDKIKNSKMGVIISYKGIDVEKDTQLRKELREAELDYFVVKNSILRFASKEVGYDFEKDLHGTTAVAFSKEDPIMVSKILMKYAKELKETSEFYVKTGFLDGKVIEVGLINELGSLPSKEELLSKILFLLTYPMKSFAFVVDSVAKKNSNEESAS